jgi:hypothetical protein
MILTIKTMKQEVYNIELDDLDISVETVKALIQSKYEFDAGKLKLLFNGAVLANTSNLKQQGINDTHVLVMLNAHKVKEGEASTSEGVNNIPSVADVDEILEEEEKQCEADIKVEEIPQVVASIMKIMCLKDPNGVKKYFEQLKNDNPQVYNVIKSKEADFKKLLYSPITKLDRRIYRKFYKGEDLNDLDRQGSSGENLSNVNTGSDNNVVNNTETSPDEINIQNLMAFGFNRKKAEEAYFICDRNYELAMNYLLDNI